MASLLPTGTILLRPSEAFPGQYHAGLIFNPAEFDNGTISFPHRNYTSPFVVAYEREGDLDWKPQWYLHSVVNTYSVSAFRLHSEQPIALQFPKGEPELDVALKAYAPRLEELERNVQPQTQQHSLFVFRKNITAHLLRLYMLKFHEDSMACGFYSGLMLQSQLALHALPFGDHYLEVIDNSLAHVTNLLDAYAYVYPHIPISHLKDKADKALLLWAHSVRQMQISISIHHREEMLARAKEQVGLDHWRPTNMNCQHLVAYIAYGPKHALAPGMFWLDVIDAPLAWTPSRMDQVRIIVVLLFPLLHAGISMLMLMLMMWCCQRQIRLSALAVVVCLLCSIVIHGSTWPFILDIWLNGLLRSDSVWQHTLDWSSIWFTLASLLLLPMIAQLLAVLVTTFALSGCHQSSLVCLAVLLAVVAPVHRSIWFPDSSIQQDFAFQRVSMPAVLLQQGLDLKIDTEREMTSHLRVPFFCNLPEEEPAPEDEERVVQKRGTLRIIINKEQQATTFAYGTRD